VFVTTGEEELSSPALGHHTTLFCSVSNQHPAPPGCESVCGTIHARGRQVLGQILEVENVGLGKEYQEMDRTGGGIVEQKTLFPFMFMFNRIKKEKTRGRRCHTKTIMSSKDDKFFSVVYLHQNKKGENQG
jgi:hypothetical protein